MHAYLKEQMGSDIHSREQAINFHRAMTAELEYYKEVIKEQAAIIKQLTEGPGEVEYIHPLDLMHIVNQTPVSEFVLDLYDQIFGYFISGQKKYKQSVHIPAKHKEII
jgi:hypothetical protein